MQLPVLDALDPQRAARVAFARGLEAFNLSRPILVVGHFDADGLSAVAILARALRRRGRAHEIRILGKGENPWDDVFAVEVSERSPGGMIVADLGVRHGAIAAGIPTIIIDHHVPTGSAGGAFVISGNGLHPEPTSALLAWWCVGALGPAEEWLWLAALGLIGEHGRAVGVL